MAIARSKGQLQPTDAQMVTVHGKPTAVVLSAEEYARLTRRKSKLSSALLQPELAAEDLDIFRSR
jgi:PHD/YefM family antitoxin component YafN of YafNO toxin-antitoxin module